MLLGIKRLFLVRPHRPFFRYVAAVVLVVGLLSWLLGEERWPRTPPKKWRDTTIEAGR